MNEMILIDLETQGFTVESGIYEVACLAVKDGEIIDRLYLGKEIPDYAHKRVYGYGFEDISADPLSIQSFQSFVQKYNYPLVAHNCPFDKKFLVHYDWIDDRYPMFCSMRAIRSTHTNLERYGLGSLLMHCHVRTGHRHTAFGDVEGLHRVLLTLKPTNWFPTGTSIPKQKTKLKARPLEEIDLNLEKTHILANEIVCFTGASPYTRNTMQEIALLNGADVTDRVISSTTMLVVGADAGSKLAKALDLGITIISDEEFMNRLSVDGIEDRRFR